MKFYRYDEELCELQELQESSAEPGSFSLSDQLQNWDGRVQCCDCNNWVWGSEASLGRKIRHSSRCCTETAQPVSTYKRPPAPKPIKKAGRDNLAKAARDHKAGIHVDPDVVFDAYKAGHLSMSDAMNSDF